MRNTILCGDALTQLRTLPDESVHCVVTSPPYWGLRDYGVDGQIGLEATPEEFVCGMVEVFREVRRVLRSDGTVWLNLGDAYAHANSGGGGAVDVRTDGRKTTVGDQVRGRMGGANTMAAGLKPKDLVGIPWRVAFALQADGWWLRSDIIWSKPNPMPESVTDRPTKAHEYIFLLTKAERYFYDAEAIKEAANPEYFGRYKYQFWGDESKEGQGAGRPDGASNTSGHKEVLTTRNKRTVWEIPTHGYKEAHFATFPEDLIRPCIQAGTSEYGCCVECGAPWERVTEKSESPHDAQTASLYEKGSNASRISLARQAARARGEEYSSKSVTTGWRPTCAHTKAQTRSGIVLDPFFGSGTTGYVAAVCGRDWIGIELNPAYVELAENRLLRVKARLL